MRSLMMILGLLLIALCHPSFAQSTAAAPAPAEPAAPDGVQWTRLLYDLNRNLTLDCRPVDPAAALADSYSWTVNGTALAAGDARFKLSAQGAVLAAERAGEELWGNYSCAAAGLPARAWRVAARPVLRLPPDAHVVEGQRLRLACRVLGRPLPALRWTFRRSREENATDALAALGDRASVNASAAGVPGAELTVDPAAAADAGFYACEADDAVAPAETQLRVKDMYAALWPFLGICAEVFILCAIILVYERRRTKPELDDSDTDNHEQ